MLNYLATLGWGAPDGVEIRPIGEIIELFELDDIGKSSALFDLKKLTHFNGEYIRALDPAEFVARAEPWITGPDAVAGRALRPRGVRAGALVQERTKVMSEIPELVDWLFLPGDARRPRQLVEGDGKPHAVAVLDSAVAGFEAAGEWTADTVRAVVEQAARDAGLVGPRAIRSSPRPRRPCASPLGRSKGLPLFESLSCSARRDHPAAPSGTEPPLAGEDPADVGREGPVPRGRPRGPRRPLPRRHVRPGLAHSGVAHGGDAGAIVVLGAAQYDGEPSPVLRARLDQAVRLYRDGRAPLIVVTGGRQEGDRFTQAVAGYRYLRDQGVPEDALLLEVDGTSTYTELAATARILRARGLERVLMVSDGYHSQRLLAIAEEVGLDGAVSPTDTGFGVRELARESLAVGLGRLVGFRRLDSLG